MKIERCSFNFHGRRGALENAYSNGEDAVTYAEAAHLVSRLIDESVARLDSVNLAPQIAELKRDRCGEDEQLDPELVALEIEDIRVAYEN